MQGGHRAFAKRGAGDCAGPNPDGDGTLLRLWEQAGEGGVCTVRLPEALCSSAVPTTFSVHAAGAVDRLRNGRYEIPLAALRAGQLFAQGHAAMKCASAAWFTLGLARKRMSPFAPRKRSPLSRAKGDETTR